MQRQDKTRKKGASVVAQTSLSPQQVARLIDHTLLKPEATPKHIVQLCAEARTYHFASVCVNPIYVRLCAQELRDVEDVAVCTVVGFPLGANLPQVKAFEAERALADGAREVDMVLRIGALKDGDQDALRQDIAAVVEVVHAHGALCKVILETALLTDEEKVLACRVAQEVGADFVKTSTGFSVGGATVEDVALMRRTVGPQMGVKASGGIRTYAALRAMVAAGATRIGASAGVRIMQEVLGQGPTADAEDTY